MVSLVIVHAQFDAIFWTSLCSTHITICCHSSFVFYSITHLLLYILLPSAPYNMNALEFVFAEHASGIIDKI